MPIHTALVSWQALQPEVMPTWICKPVGAGVANAVPGAAFVAEATPSPEGMDPRWQASQAVDDGMCEFTPTGEVGGMPISRLMPVKVVTLPPVL